MLLTAPASADRICKKVCHEGFCRSQCVERGDRLYDATETITTIVAQALNSMDRDLTLMSAAKA